MSHPIRIGDCQLDPGSHQLRREGQTIHIEPKDFSVLLHLIEASPDYVSSSALIRSTWNNTLVCDNSLHQVIRRLRRALDDDARNPQYIETLPKIGYRFIAEVEHAPLQATLARDIGVLAVVPFTDYSVGEKRPYLTQGLVMEVCRELSRLEVELVSRDQIAAALDAGVRPIDLGAYLGADYILDGTVMFEDGRLRVCAWLNQVTSGRELWSDAFDHSMVELFAAQSEVAGAIVEAAVQGARRPAAKRLRATLKRPLTLRGSRGVGALAASAG